MNTYFASVQPILLWGHKGGAPFTHGGRVAPYSDDDDTSTTTSFELVIIFLHNFSQPLCIVISLFY